jgi:hypothetical protein
MNSIGSLATQDTRRQTLTAILKIENYFDRFSGACYLVWGLKRGSYIVPISYDGARK